MPNFLEITQPRLRYGYLSIFQDGGCRHFGFGKLQNFNSRNGSEGRTASACQISSKSVKLRRSYGVFSIFQNGGRRRLGFINFKFLTVATLKRVELRHHAKFRLNRSNRGWDMAVFDFPRWRLPPSWILEISKIFKVGTVRSNCISVSNFVKIGWTAAEIWRYFHFSRWRPPLSWIFEIAAILKNRKLSYVRKKRKFARKYMHDRK